MRAGTLPRGLTLLMYQDRSASSVRITLSAMSCCSECMIGGCRWWPFVFQSRVHWFHMATLQPVSGFQVAYLQMAMSQSS